MTERKIKKEILLIEDNDDHAELAEFYIQEFDTAMEVNRLCDGEQAMNYIRNSHDENSHTPWMIFLDLKLPKYDGHEILIELKKDKRLKLVPVVIFSTSNSNKDIEQALDNYANSYVVKPIEPDRYSEIIEQTLAYWTLDQHHLAMA